MTPRPATTDDIDTLARIHVQSWRETYQGLLAPEDIAARNMAKRRALWAMIIAQGQTRVWLLDDLGFAQFGPQREQIWIDKGYPEELYAIYLLQAGYGHGMSLLQAAHGPNGQAFTADVLAENARACAFYEKTGGQFLISRPGTIGGSDFTERVYGWTKPPSQQQK